MNPLARPRRIVTAILIALFLSGGGIGVFGLAAADQEETTFQIPAAREGDRWQYAVRSDYSLPWAGTGTAEGEVGYVMLPLERWRDGNGTWRDVQVLHADHSGDEYDSFIDHLLEPSTLEPLGARGSLRFEFGYTFSTLLLQESGSWSHDGLTEVFTPLPPPCGMLEAAWGAERLPETMQGPGCPVPLRLEGVEDLDGWEAARYGFVEEHLRVQVWFASGYPYPVRIVESLDHAEAGLHFEQDARLVGFEPGHAPLAAGGAPETDPLPPVLAAERDRFGPRPMDTPYPLREAWGNAMASPVFSGLRDFVEEHPDAFIVGAWPQVIDEGDGTRHQWAIQVVGEDEEFHLQAERQVRQPLRLLGQTGPDGPATESFHGQTTGLLPFRPRADDLPGLLPTADSAADVWRELTGEGVPDAYGFEYSCSPTSEGCDVGFLLEVGTGTIPRPSGLAAAVPGRSATVTGGSSTIVVDLDGRLLMAKRTEETHSRSTGPTMVPEPVVTATEERGPTLVAAVPWSPPPTAAVAGFGVLAVLVAFLYWLWPAFGGAPFFGLFSRLRTHRLLDHPVRASLMQRIEARPGTHYQELMRAEGKGKGAVEHHLRKMEDAGLVRVERGGGRTCYFPKRTDGRAVAATVALKSDGAKAVLAAVLARPGCTAKDAASRAGLAPATVSQHIRKLADAGLLQARRGPRGALSLYPGRGAAA